MTADEVEVVLTARTSRYEADLKRAKQVFEDVTGKQRSEMASLERSITRNADGIGRSLRSLAATFAAAFSVRQIQQLADGYTRFTNQLKVAGLEGAQLGQVQEKLAEIANRNGIALESLGTLYSRSAQVAGELGASQADLINFSEGVSAALRIQGTSATESAGALLQLSQLLASGTVRAEEFNSVNEGALPILQAVARNIEAAGGSVGRLKLLVNDGKISSEQFFRAFLAGSSQLQAEAAKTSLTIGNSFTILNNKLGEFIGQTDQTLSATQRISQAIVLLADNLDKVAGAIAAVAAIMLGRYVGAAAASVRASAAVTASLGLMEARAAGMVGTMGALSTAGGKAASSLLAAFGGPIGAAVAALTVAFAYLASEAASTNAELAELNSKTAEAEQRADELQRRFLAAGGSVDGLGDAAKGTAGKVDGLNSSMGRAITTAIELANRLQQLEVVKIALQRGANEREAQSIRDRGVRNTLTGSMGMASPEYARRNPSLAKADQDRLEAIERQNKALDRQIDILAAAAKAGKDIGDKPPVASSAPADEKKKPAGRKSRASAKPTGPTAEEIEQRYVLELASINQEELAARLQLADNIEDRADIMRELLSAEYEQRLAQIENDKDFTAEQKKAQKEALAKLYGPIGNGQTGPDGEIVVNASDGGLYGRQVAKELLDRRNAQAREILGLEADALSAQADITISMKEKRKLEIKALDLSQQIQTALLEQAIANGQIAEADKDRARAALKSRQAAEQEALSRSQYSPLEQYKFDLTEISANLNEAIDAIAVDGLKNLTSNLAGAIANFQSLGDVGTAALRSLTAALIELALQQIILRTIGEAIGQSVDATAAGAKSAGQAAASGAGAATAESVAQAATVAAAWAPAAAAASLATLGGNAGPAIGALVAAHAVSAALSAAGGILARKDGGPIYGAGGPRQDRVLVAASPEEYMLSAKAARMLGRSTLDFMNATGRLPGRADGGPIMPELPRGSPMRSGGGPDLSPRFEQQLGGMIDRAIKAMPAINLYPTLDPGNVMRAALATTGGRKAMFDFVSANSGKFRSQLD